MPYLQILVLLLASNNFINANGSAKVTFTLSFKNQRPQRYAHSIFRSFFIVIISVLLNSCISVSLTSVATDPNFNWDALKRDQILMTPLLDLRRNVMTPPGMSDKVAPLTDKEREAYAEKFKQAFFKLRKDIRVFGAGGAFEKISVVENLPELGTRILQKETLSNEDVETIRASTQDIRFVFFFTFVGEELHYNYRYEKPAKKKYFEKQYMATRAMDIKMALWDSKTARTVWIGQKKLNPTNLNVVKILQRPRFGSKNSKKDDVTEIVQEPDQWDLNGRSSLDEELQFHKARFPDFPGREPSFTESFDDFVLGLPIHPSEEKLIEYSYFTHHRGEIGIASSGFGKKAAGQFFLTLTSIINNRFRLGIGFLGDGMTKVDSEGKAYQIGSSGFGLVSDLEWKIADKWMLMTGATFGGLVFSVEDPLLAATDNGNSGGSASTQQNQQSKNTDYANFVRPRLHFLYGERRGGQIGFGVHGIFYDGIERPEIKANRPVKWGVDLGVSYTVRGF